MTIKCRNEWYINAISCLHIYVSQYFQYVAHLVYQLAVLQTLPQLMILMRVLQ